MTAPTISCPLCGETFEIPQPQYAPGVAAVFGMHAESLAAIHLDQERKRLEANVERHLKTHTLEQWVTAVRAARAERDSYLSLLQMLDRAPA